MSIQSISQCLRSCFLFTFGLLYLCILILISYFWLHQLYRYNNKMASIIQWPVKHCISFCFSWAHTQRELSWVGVSSTNTEQNCFTVERITFNQSETQKLYTVLGQTSLLIVGPLTSLCQLKSIVRGHSSEYLGTKIELVIISLASAKLLSIMC